MQVNYEPWKLQKEGKEYWGVRILDGKFKELTIAINDVKMDEDDSVSVDYDVVYSAVPTKEVTESTEWNEVLSYVIQDILVKAMNEYENRERNSEQSRNG